MTIGKSLGDKAKELIPRLSRSLLQAGPVVGPAVNLATGGIWGALTSGSMDFVKRFFSETENVEKIFKRLSKALEEQKRRFLVLIDDIDRLTPDEALLIFRLVKSVGRLPNVMYLLVFDRELAEKAVKERYPSEGPHFLEKIIQASFELPLPARDDLNNAALVHIETLCGPPKDKAQLLRFMNIFYDAVSPYLNTPRDLTRLFNAMTVSWPAVSNEVDMGDYVALEIMRLFEPQLYNAIRRSKKNVCGVSSEYGHQENPEKEIEKFLQLVPEERREIAKYAFIRLFPRFENVGYSYSSIEAWEAQRLVCTEKHFDTYFRMYVGDETLPIAEIKDLIAKSGDVEYVKATFKKAIISIRKNGKSKVPLLLDELNINAPKIDKNNLQPLITAIFAIADDIYRDADRERGDAYGDNHLRIHWLIRKLTFDRCSLDERSNILVKACENAQVGWLVDFANSAIRDYYPREGREPEPPEKCLISKEQLSDIKNIALRTIESSADTGELIFNPQLPFILFKWKEFAEDDGLTVLAWTKEKLKSDEAVSMFAQAFTSESWSQGMGIAGLGDRVAIKNFKASIDGLEKIIDLIEFRRRLEEIENKEQIDEKLKEKVIIFLTAWRKKEEGKDR